MDLKAMKERRDAAGGGGRHYGYGAAAAAAVVTSSSPVDGLKLGKRTYFRDMGAVATTAKRSSFPAVPSVAATPTKRARGVVQKGQPPRCQVEDCKVDLTGFKAYYCRHKVCGMHSKSPKVIVAGIEQRFCQQCSRFHQLSEFDQGKRSCRRRLAGHNERRRKPPPGSISSHYGRVPSTVYDSRIGGLLVDFTFPRHTGKDVWPTLRAREHASNHIQATGKYLSHVWQGDASAVDILSPEVHPFFQGSYGASSFSSQEISLEDCFSGVSGHGCALSLLSHQSLGSKGRPSGIIALNHLLNDEEASMNQPHVAQPCSGDCSDKLRYASSQWCATFPPFATYSPSAILEPVSPTRKRSSGWSFRNHDASNSHEVHSEIRSKQASELHGSQFPGELQLASQGDRQLMDIGHLRVFGPSSHNTHWGL